MRTYRKAQVLPPVKWPSRYLGRGHDALTDIAEAYDLSAILRVYATMQEAPTIKALKIGNTSARWFGLSALGLGHGVDLLKSLRKIEIHLNVLEDRGNLLEALRSGDLPWLFEVGKHLEEITFGIEHDQPVLHYVFGKAVWPKLRYLSLRGIDLEEGESLLTLLASHVRDLRSLSIKGCMLYHSTWDFILSSMRTMVFELDRFDNRVGQFSKDPSLTANYLFDGFVTFCGATDYVNGNLNDFCHFGDSGRCSQCKSPR